MRMIQRLFTGVFAVILISALFVSYILFAPLSSERGAGRYNVNQGDSVEDVAQGLAQAGLIKNAWIFRLVWGLEGGGMIQTGTYTTKSAASMHALYRVFSSSPDRTEIPITIIEGWTSKQIAGYLSERMVHVDGFLQATRRDWKRDYPFLSGVPSENGLEGYLFPDTYRVYEDSDSESVIRKMLNNFNERFSEDMRRDARNQGYTIHQIVTLASIIEREVKGKQEKMMVSDIFRRRLLIGMPLQADSTINYITGKKDPQAIGSDLQIVSAYNTYTYKGLPPGPIGNPGLESMNAALHPIPNRYLYFLTDSAGNAHFSETYEEHKNNKATYL